MEREVRVPKWGLTIERIEMVAWIKHPGDDVAEGEVLCEVETDKANAEIEAPVAGMVKSIAVEVGGEARVGDVVCTLLVE